ncbi:isoprenylcysteine carboxylmethyltransferase family protein [uncultured Cohaesibacter sp.]|uniref:methyltransferase family protein n=1 Tax=uncultured Cohaesibacter sp. TaxID=1002546 RepID=UPI0029C8FEDF|nr:isoprenylcysteine carboxylmethyltransferase family protein [uncultured Cohaesibacter sp.]
MRVHLQKPNPPASPASLSPASPGIRFAIPPLIFGLCAGSALALEWAFFFDVGPLSAVGVPVVALIIAGFLVGAAGFAFMGWGFVHFRLVGTSLNTAVAASSLVDGGAFRFSRNPMYVGFVVMLLGGTILFDSLPFLLAALIMFLYLDRFVIPREEAYLRAAFGADYADYCARVRRWL